jgi:hypothetical protein
LKSDDTATTFHIFQLFIHPSTKERMNRIDEELIEATRESNLPEVRGLLRAGADVNSKDGSDWTPLHWACNLYDGPGGPGDGQLLE